ncbi:transcriptional regulator [Heyndrickxia shackletonii]|uniref:Transcriptional regulator n=1 Tax=Heyndrickxia shackletonii TaxID=157838 RepID=A0A0Q3WV31_9BACI|nr:helix-turn-helix transcriptional regulator [Heyndrickxia shackletonii]KQL52778.1 transcriptional regulator [Heyndrickxia shackletonii]MBB2481990.1 helix-turn-helix transcriptional regulator [Bacillus sp. APMAM]NEZ00090.1 helix-turn-helix transcriptional regulator [Heyndrickxia shackletonii]RTZ54661.1 XRE family transcriptional regulator [Bacillus sp. SAJ1]
MIGQRIKELRRGKGYSISKLALLAGVSKSYLSYIERGLRNNPSLDFLSRIAEPLDTTVDFLLNEQVKTLFQDTNIDEEWKILLNKAIDNGMTKEDFLTLQNFIEFKNWKIQNS